MRFVLRDKCCTLQDTCPVDMVCYCPDIGLCEVYNYSIPLHDLITNDTHEGDHNREYHFTFQVMNEAHLTTFERVSASNTVPTPGSSDTHVKS